MWAVCPLPCGFPQAVDWTWSYHKGFLAGTLIRQLQSLVIDTQSMHFSFKFQVSPSVMQGPNIQLRGNLQHCFLGLAVEPEDCLKLIFSFQQLNNCWFKDGYKGCPCVRSYCVADDETAVSQLRFFASVKCLSSSRILNQDIQKCIFLKISNALKKIDKN